MRVSRKISITIFTYRKELILKKKQSLIRFEREKCSKFLEPTWG